MNTTWNELHSAYQGQHWVDIPSIFAETAIQYFPAKGTILELGAGYGQDSIFFAKQGYDVFSSDIEISSLKKSLAKQPEAIQKKITAMQIDLKSHLPFEDQSLDVAYAHLSLHYFDKKTTQQIMNEIRRVLKPNGVLAFLTNSTSDPEYQTGTPLEEDFFLIDKFTKRYFSIESVKDFTQGFQTSLLDNQGETYKDRAVGVLNLIRFIGHLEPHIHAI